MQAAASQQCVPVKKENRRIDTYGKIDRENPEKISQSIQFDKQTAEFFVDLLKKEFDI